MSTIFWNFDNSKPPVISPQDGRIFHRNLTSEEFLDILQAYDMQWHKGLTCKKEVIEFFFYLLPNKQTFLCKTKGGLLSFRCCLQFLRLASFLYLLCTSDLPMT